MKLIITKPTLIDGKIIYPKIPKGLSKTFNKYLRKAILAMLLGRKLPGMGPGLKAFVDEFIQPRNDDDIKAWISSHKKFPYLKEWMLKQLRQPDQSWQKRYS